MKNEKNRRLAAIMFTDMVGFTALMQRDEELGLQKRDRHRTVFQNQHKKHNGEIIQYFGDGTLSIFENPNDAVKCAVEMQRDLKSPIEVPLRIGIHSGNVLVESDGIIGDAVNIASRIESFANVGGVLISDIVQDQIKNQVKWETVGLGKFNLKNVDRKFEIYAIKADGIAVPDPNFLKGKGDLVASLKTVVPIPPTPLLGRDVELSEIIDLLQTNKVVTITGTGGLGKTRLSLELANRLKYEFLEGIAFVSLATLTDATEVIPALAETLDVKEAEGREMIDGVALLISDKKILLILDNLEQVISAAQEIAQLISRCPNLKILCTSRTPLKIKAEQEYPLHPLPLPDGDQNYSIEELLNYSSIQLFMDRAQQVNVDFNLTVENANDVLQICRRMDGLPLALELAAARIRILPADKLLQRLTRALDVLTTGSKDLPERHQTLRATIDWSYTLLNEAEQKLFRNISVFAGSFTLEGVETVCYQSENDAFNALDELESLLDKALVEKASKGNRFNMLQTINDFASEKLQESGEADIYKIRHVDYYLNITEEIFYSMYGGGDQVKNMRKGIDSDTNINAALDYLLLLTGNGEIKSAEKGLLICGNLTFYWHVRSKHLSSREYCLAFLNSEFCPVQSVGKAKTLITLGLANWTLGHFEKAIEINEEAFKMADALEMGIEKVMAKLTIGLSYLSLGNMDLAIKYVSESRELGRTQENEWVIAFSIAFSGILDMINGNVSLARSRFNKALEIQLRLNDLEGTATCYGGLAALDAGNGNFDQSIEQYKKALDGYEKIGDRAEEARILNEMAWTYLAMKDTKSSRHFTIESIQAYQDVGSMRGVGIALTGLAAIAGVENRPFEAMKIAAAAEYFAENEGIVNVYADMDQGKPYIDKAKNSISDDELLLATTQGRSLSLNDVLKMSSADVIELA